MNLSSLCSRHFPATIPPGSCIFNLAGSSAALLLALQDRAFLAIEKEETAAETLWRDIVFFRLLFGLQEQGRIIHLPEPYGPDQAGRRSRILFELTAGDSLVTTTAAIRSAAWTADVLADLPQLEKGLQISREFLEERLNGLGYRQVPVVAEPGEYSRRGFIFDLFPAGAASPVRAEFFGDEVEEFRFFDIDSQLSAGDAPEMTIFPAQEAEVRDEDPGILSSRRLFSFVAGDDGLPLPGDAVMLSRFSFAASPERGDEDAPAQEQIDAGLLPISGLGVLKEERKGFADLAQRVVELSRERPVLLVASSDGQAKRLQEIFRDEDKVLPLLEAVDGHDSWISPAVGIGPLSAGLFLPDLLVLTEREIFGERPRFRPLKQMKGSRLLAAVDDIAPGDFVVHRDHGIGRFTAAVHQHVEENEIELLQIEYEDGRLYVPIQNIGILGKYRAEEGVLPKADRLGGKTWQRKKERAKKKIDELAGRLIELYGDRSAPRGFRFSADAELHREFDSFFPYEETQDQSAAIRAIKEDMESERPMDRLLCGDVGYGKTEVAMRAAFKAVYDGRQVAVLVPTTILAEQHQRTFRERFSGFPVRIEHLSRFRTAKETREVLRAVAAGEVDIVIGTHALLAKKVSFASLGLLILDEEHRFGVAQKERIKEMSRQVDVLALTATPIPRTLHMALSGIRDISLIETPPEERLAVRTVITTFRPEVIGEAISHELERNGQVFFVHNRISDIYRIAELVQGLVPAARISAAHGQMAERELEDVMHRFFAGETDVLVSTAIVGAGLDIVRANTIIVDRSHRMGLADLYQLRGRVGRGSRKGYAYFIIPGGDAMTDEAKRRIQALQEMSYLGAGFRLAMRDLEIRGAGNVFGAEQSGHIHEIGFDLYVEMLEHAVAERKGEVLPDEPEPVIELKTSAFIPEQYVSDPTLRMSLYRRLSACTDEEEIDRFDAELRDRFGVLPQEVISLLGVVRIKILSRRLSVERIREERDEVRVRFSERTAVQPAHLFAFQERLKGNVRFYPDGFGITARAFRKADALESLRRVLAELCEDAGR